MQLPFWAKGKQYLSLLIKYHTVISCIYTYKSDLYQSVTKDLDFCVYLNYFLNNFALTLIRIIYGYAEQNGLIDSLELELFEW